MKIFLSLLFVLILGSCLSVKAHEPEYSCRPTGHVEVVRETYLISAGRYESQWVSIRTCDACGSPQLSGYWLQVWIAPKYGVREVRRWTQGPVVYYQWPALDDSPKYFRGR